MFCFWIGEPGIVGSGGLFLMSYEFSFINIFSLSTMRVACH